MEDDGFVPHRSLKFRPNQRQSDESQLMSHKSVIFGFYEIKIVIRSDEIQINVKD